MMACPEQKESFMRVKVRQKDGKWYVFINHHGQRKAKCVGDSKRAAEEVKCKYVSEQLGHASIKITVDTYGHPRQGTSIALADRLDTLGEETRRKATVTQPTRQSVGSTAGIAMS
jgi:hypothetical protein